ncbi:MAG: peptidylprolyl isomerase [Gammaproteobacteria bacterium]|nr:peptidylprolyl isomerase [Gammaproteobacteria bacterium]NNJ72453.1 peptidylprolyl isomerase [Enterobacterales bacterium]
MAIQTNLGKVVVQLFPSAPYTSYNFYQLATTGYYDGTEFHRVIPGFVVQGGDFKGTSIDGPGYRIREELYPIRHLKGTLGMASLGKDTAGAGFYFNLKDNYHLDRGYTVFARVVSGFDVVQKLGVGDRILSVTEYQAP